jgi:hypothetical protein
MAASHPAQQRCHHRHLAARCACQEQHSLNDLVLGEHRESSTTLRTVTLAKTSIEQPEKGMQAGGRRQRRTRVAIQKILAHGDCRS